MSVCTSTCKIYAYEWVRDYCTQALTENCMVCRSQRTEVALEPAVADVPEVLVVDPAVSIWV